MTTIQSLRDWTDQLPNDALIGRVGFALVAFGEYSIDGVTHQWRVPFGELPAAPTHDRFARYDSD